MSETPRPQQDGVTEPVAATAPAFDSVVLDRSDPEFLNGAYEAFAQMRAVGKVVRARHCPLLRDGDEGRRALAGERPLRELLFVCQHEAASEALSDPRLSSNPLVLVPPEARARMPPMPAAYRLFASSLVMKDPPDHTRLRKLVQPSFSPRAMEALRPRIQRLCDELLDAAEGGAGPERRMDLIPALAYPLPIAVISDLLGIPEADRPAVAGWAAFRAESRDPVIMARTAQQFEEFGAYLRRLIEHKRGAPGDDMITQMLQAQEDGDRLSEDELLSMIFLLYLAGHVTTVNLIGNGVVALLRHPEQAARLRADPSLAAGAVEETLRYWAPLDFFGTPRTATDHFSLGGVAIPRGAQVLIGLSAANRDPLRFSDPDTFDITRPEAARHLAFGRGIHACLGAPLARLEGQIVLATLFRRYPQLRLAVPDSELSFSGANGTRGFRAIPLLF